MPRNRSPGPGSGADPERPFWRAKRLEEMNAAEWESLCDGCGRCCLVKLEDEDTGAVAYTDVSCTLLDGGTCRCRDYPRRQEKVPDCVRLTPETVRGLRWLPRSCGYRRVAEGRDLAPWHPLRSGDPNSVHRAGISVRGRLAGPEDDFTVDDLLDRVVTWPETADVPRRRRGTHPGRPSSYGTPGRDDAPDVFLRTKERAMGFFSSPIKTMDDLYLHQLQDIYYAEKQITKALPKMIEKAGNPALKQAFQKHLGETEQQVKRLEDAFAAIGQTAKGATCQAIDGIIGEAEELMSDCDDTEVRDAAMVAAAQAVEHYEITRYGTLISWSKQLGHQKVVTLLQQTLTEEKATDEALTRLGESNVNRKAA